MKKLTIVLVVALLLIAAAPAIGQVFSAVLVYPPADVRAGDTLTCSVLYDVSYVGQPERMGVALKCRKAGAAQPPAHKCRLGKECK